MIYNNLGLIYSNYKSDNKKAENFYKRSIALDQKIAEPHNNLGTLYNGQDKFSHAIKSYKQALLINPKLAQTHHNIGNTYITIGNFNEAEKHFKESIKINKLFY